ncbi:ParB N-terminal domain-containing protein [Rhodomicrobium vannielii ATCC 17100]|uniref:ParB/RepB/Spo0J family partition protein n=1 Tax=Rhodomicrobium vannielii TaxID=1069 RepID=UPI001918FE10|nr:ParB/RepB/Spo0J family partition protein [Rhodomicrobium vannielii]MBJ7535397.1 ParB N-terminal domain-containing protein [Rhodomicrobium vannielii ATCC 17100]
MSDDPFVRLIPLSKLVPSLANVRKTAREIGVEELAASIAAHGLLQNLTVRPVLDGNGNETGKFEVVAGGRRLAALKLLAKRKEISKTFAVPCALVSGFSGEEVSLAENMFQAPMHPADQYEALAKLQAEQGQSAEDIAARFGVTPAVVKQRLRLGAVSPLLINIYREGEITLDQLMAFTITDDHALQERVWKELTWNKSKEMIRRLLVEGHVEADDRRARFIGVDAFEAAGGHIVRDLFDAEHEGYFDDPELLHRLVAEKLAAAAEPVRAEGWKWIMVAPEFHYAAASGMRRVFPEDVTLSEDDQAKLDALESELEALSIKHADENLTDELAAEFDRLESGIEALRPERYRPEDIAICGAFVSLDQEGKLRVERGFLRPEDAPRGSDDEVTSTGTVAEEGAMPDEGREEERPDDEGATPLSDRLVAELTAHRTAAMQALVAQSPDIALLTITHALVAQQFYHARHFSCLGVDLATVRLDDRAPGIGDSPAVVEYNERVKAVTTGLPREARDLWDHLSRLDRESLLALLAVSISPAVNVIKLAWEKNATRERAADQLAQTLALDMTHFWSPTAESYFGSVTKAHILEAVREGVSEEAAERLHGMKKEPMTKAAEELLKGTGWLPVVLRSGAAEDAPSYAMAAE